MTTTETPRIRKSEKLTGDEYKAFVKWCNAQPTLVDAAETIGISREVLGRVRIVKSGSPATIEKVRQVLAKEVGTNSSTK